MKIGINVYYFKRRTVGLGQYLMSLLNTFKEIDQQNEYAILGLQSRMPRRFRPTPSYHVHTVPTWAKHNKNVERVVWEQLTAPAAARKAGVDVYHVPYFAPPLIPRTPTVITIPDLIPFRLAPYLEGAVKKAYMRLNAQATYRADLIITFSQHVKRDIIDVLKVPPERIRVIYLAAGDEYHPVTDPSDIAKVCMRYGLGEHYIFYLGGLDYRKNVTQLVRAFAHLYHRLDDPDLQLFIAGDPANQSGSNLMFPDPRPVATELGLTNQIVYRFVEEKDKPALYSGAQVFVFPSLYEGFGLPPLEAMGCGAPVICSNRTSLPEVVGDAAISLDPDDTQALVEAMYVVLTNRTLRGDLRARSLQRVTQFDWRKTAEETIAVYEEVFALSRK